MSSLQAFVMEVDMQVNSRTLRSWLPTAAPLNRKPVIKTDFRKELKHHRFHVEHKHGPLPF